MNTTPSPIRARLEGGVEDAKDNGGLHGVVLITITIFSVVAIWSLTGNWMLTAGLLIGMGCASALIYFAFTLRQSEVEAAPLPPDWTITRMAADRAQMGIAICDRAGRLACANDLFASWFDGMRAPPNLPVDAASQDKLAELARIAWRDGHAASPAINRGAGSYRVDVARAGLSEHYLVWTFEPVRRVDLVDEAAKLIDGVIGTSLSRAFVMAVIIGPEGRILAANSGFAARATGDANANLKGRDFSRFLRAGKEDRIYFDREGARGIPVRLLPVPLSLRGNGDDAGAPNLILLIDEEPGGAAGDLRAYVENLIATMPLGLALVDREGRFQFANATFRNFVGVLEGDLPLYPGDLVVKEDKGPLADTIRRFANGHNQTGDIAVRFAGAPDDVVSLSIGGLRGLGDTGVLLSLKDNSEESTLKRQVAQATKMQAVGQLAGGVAHDFNNILTAILGLCDLMLQRHSPGDSDYDDVQQVKNNANRAANLTRQLLAFSRQQTLRPQIIQLPDIVSDTSAMLKRLMGEKVALEVSHGRGIGAVRADPGQLGQVIMNLAVNARDAVLSAGGKSGTVRIETGPVSAADVRRMKSDILPAADYARVSVTDTGTGIDKAILPKIFEPFFTTKAVGKGTGLGLSTVYGIVKQSGGFIFADNEPSGGARFDVYLPVYRGSEQAVTAAAAPKETPLADENWGSGHILLVEDEDMVRAVAERALTRQGYTVDTACDGEEAVELLKSGTQYDLIVSDVVMPNMDGPTMGRAARAMRPDIRILFMSGYAEEQLRRDIDLENIGFLPKPFSIPHIAEAAARMIRG